MKSKSMFMQMLVIILVLLMAVPPVSFAQEPGGPPPLKQEEVEQVVAPIALYPDSLMAQILMASTYPLDIVQAARWAKENKGLQGDKLEAELMKKAWDPSVKSLVSFPQVLTMMNDNLEWTQKMGNAFLSQQKDVMDAVQRLRGKAQAAGYLKTTPEQKVIVEQTADVQIIKVEPATQVVYVPTYNPTVVYGTWAYPAYPPPPVYPPGYVATAAFSFAAGVAVGAAVYGGMNWGHSNSAVFVNNNYNYNKANINRGNINTGNINRGNVNTGNINRGNVNRATPYGQGGAGRTQAQQNAGARGYGQAGAKAQPAAAQRGQQPAASQRPSQPSASQRPSQAGAQRPSQPSAFGGAGGGGMQERAASSRGQSSRSAGGFSGGRGGGGGFQGGGRGGGGMGGGGRGGGGRGGGRR